MTPTPQATKSISWPLFFLLGVAFWLTGVLFVQLGGAALFVPDRPWLLLLFAISVPISWIFIKVIAIIGQVSGPDLLKAVVVSTITATLLDGTVLTWFQAVYSHEPTTLLLIAAWLLWGGGVGLLVGYWESWRSIDSKQH